MKNKISVLFLGVVSLLACANFVAAGELLAFDTVYQDPQAALKKQTVLTAEAQPQAVNTAAVNPFKDRLVVVKELLKDISVKDRVEFMSSIKLINGRVASQGYAVLERNGMSSARIDEILQAFESSEATMKAYIPVANNDMIRVGELFANVPEQAKEDFFDNMKFLNGGVASAKTESMEKAVAPEKLDEILDVFMPAMRMASDKSKIVTRVKDEVCETWIHHDEKTTERNCNPLKKYNCNPSVCK